VHLRIWRSKKKPELLLDLTPTGQEEEENLFDTPVNQPTDLNEQILRERVQDMGERIIFADRAFLLALIWVVFLVILPVLQLIFSIWGKGLSDVQFSTVITTTTASVFGFWYLVGRYLFPNNGTSKK
jgi:hypothetical protein